MTIKTENFSLSDIDVENVLRMVLANKAKEELVQFNYFAGDISDKDSARLKRLCSFDYTIMPQKDSEEYLDWIFYRNELADICSHILDVHYNIGVASYSMPYTEKYTLVERFQRWSEVRQENMSEIDEIVNELIK